jgi:hypothetical protein
LSIYGDTNLDSSPLITHQNIVTPILGGNRDPRHLAYMIALWVCSDGSLDRHLLLFGTFVLPGNGKGIVFDFCVIFSAGQIKLYHTIYNQMADLTRLCSSQDLPRTTNDPFCHACRCHSPHPRHPLYCRDRPQNSPVMDCGCLLAKRV